MEIEFIDELKQKASKLNKTIILPESHDERVLKAAEKLTKEKIAAVITLGDEYRILKDAKKLDVDLTGVRIIDQTKSDKLSDFTNIFYRKIPKSWILRFKKYCATRLVFCCNDGKRKHGRWKCSRFSICDSRCYACRNSMRWNAGRYFNRIELFPDAVS